MRWLVTCLLILAACGGDVKALQVPQVYGLRRDANPQAKVPLGGTRIAANCVVKRVGLIESRPGFKKSSNTHATIKPNRLLPWRELGSLLAVNADTTVAWWDALATPVKNEAGANITMVNPYFNRGASARKNFYINASDGIRKLTSTSDVVADAAGFGGLPVIGDDVVYGVGSPFLAVGYYASYRAILVRTDVNGLITRSASSGAFTVYNNLGAAQSALINVYLPSDAVAGDAVELYRSDTSAVYPPSNELFLTQSAHTITATNISNGFVTFSDFTTDALLGADLYTNDSLEGVEGSNFRPPSAGDVAFFRDSLFFLGTTGPERFALNFSQAFNATGVATGIGARTISGTRTNASAVVTMASTTGLKVGMMLSDGTTWSGSAPVIIQSIVVNTSVTVNATWGGATDGGTVSLTWWDTVMLSTGSYYPMPSAGIFMRAINCGYSAARVTASALFYAYDAGEYSIFQFGGLLGPTNNTTVVIEERLRGHGQSGVYQVRATHGSEYNPALAETNVTATNFFQADISGSGLAWSKTYEPESVPLPNFARIGSDQGVGLRIIPTRDALFIFKQDGLWRLSGVSADSGWRIDPFDPTLKLLQPDGAVVYGDTIYAFTNRGFVAVSDAGVMDIDANAISNDLEGYIRKFSSFANWKLGTWATADETNGLVLFGLPSATAGTDPSATIYCFNTNTKEFTTWETTTAQVSVAGALASAVHMTFEPVSAKLVAAQSAADIVTQRLDTDSPAYVNADYETAVTITAIDVTLLTTLGTKFTITAGSGWAPTLGDAVVRASVPCVVTSLVDATHFYVYASGAVTTGAATAYQAIYNGIEFTAQGNPSIAHVWLTANVDFQALNGVRQFDYSFISSSGAGVSTGKTKTVTYSAPSLTENSVTENPETVRLFVDRNSARSTVTFPGFLIHQALSNWRMSGFTLFYNDSTEKVGR